MKYLKTFENYIDIDKQFDIDEDVLSYVFTDLLEKYPNITIKLEEVDKENFKIELFDKDNEAKDLTAEFHFLQNEKVLGEVKGQFDVMDFNIKSMKYDKEARKIILIIHQL